MRISRLYVSIPLNIGQKIELDKESEHYLRSVLRLKKQAQVILFNGLGGEYRCTLLEVSRKIVHVSIDEKISRSVESPLEVSIGMGISRGDRMDMSVQKSVELGVNHITPIITQRCNVVIKDGKYEQKLNHWQKIAQHAAEQCGRTVVPKINPIVSFSSWIETEFTGALKIFLDPYAEKPLTQLKNQHTKVVLLTGSEGGFCEQERQLAISHQFVPIRLGQRILRTETASLAAIAAVQLLWGDFG
jgi:16S rRNA (uracil1498-N3)-methyltransferase